MKHILKTLAFILITTVSFAQVGIGTKTPAASSILDIESTTKGLLPPRMTTTQRNAIAGPVAGLMIYNTTNSCLQWFNGTWWFNACNGATEIPGFALTCGSATSNPKAFNRNVAYTGTITVPYTGGNGGAYPAGSPISSTGVTGFTATLVAGTLANGAGNLTLNISGSSAVGGIASFAFTFGGQSCTLTISSCGAIVNGTFKEFMCENLGVTGSQDRFSYQSGANNGALYQWGRQTDGHEVRTSATQAGPVAAPVANRFITNNVGSPSDWINPQNTTLWGDGTTGANPAKNTTFDPCPAGFEVPSQAQWGALFRNGLTSGAPNTATNNTWTWTGNGFTVGNNLYLPAAGYRSVFAATLLQVDTIGYYWSSTVNSTSAYYLQFNSTTVSPGNFNFRGVGQSVRCISE